MREAIEAFKDKYAAGLQFRPEDVLTVDAMDEMIHQARAELGAWTMRASVDNAVQEGLAGDRPCSCGGHLKLHHRPALKVQSVQGEYEARGVSYRCDQCGRTLRPVHVQLGIESYSVTTRLLDELSSDFFLDRGAPTAVQRMQRHHGIEPGRTTVLSHAEQRGKQAREFLDDKLRQATVAAEQRRGSKAQVDRVFVQMDSSSGKTVQPLKRPEAVGDEIERTPIRGLPKVERPIEGKQVKLLCAQAKGELQWVYDAYIGDYDDAPDKLVGLAATRGWQDGVPVVMTADGDEKIREAGEGAFNPDFDFVLDREHAIKHLRDVPTYGKDAITESPDAWVAAAKDLLHSGQVQDVIQHVQSIAQQVEDEKDRIKVDNVATYFQERASAVHYDYFKEQGWPQGSGAVEGGHIHIIHPISKRGAGWLRDNLNHTIALACVRASGWWDEFWQWTANPPGSQAQAAALN
jgi:gas vesicle protein